MSRESKKVMVAMDGSGYALQATDYIRNVLPPDGCEVELFHVMNIVPESFWDWEKDPMEPSRLEYLKAWETQKENDMRRLMEGVRESFLNAGFPEQSIKIRIQERTRGIARDILTEISSGHDVLVLGRRGMSSLDEHLLGSIATKVVNRASNCSICLVSGKPKRNKILIAMDASDGAARAVDLAARMFGDTQSEMALVHVIRGISVSSEGFESIFPEGYRTRLMEEAENAIKPAFERAAERLKAAGINREKISTQIITGVPSRAGSIMDKARREGFGTIFVGRRGVTQLEEFTMGRVTSKLIQMSKDMALWIVA